MGSVNKCDLEHVPSLANVAYHSSVQNLVHERRTFRETQTSSFRTWGNRRLGEAVRLYDAF